MENIEILEVNDNLKDLLEEEKVKRQTLLNETNEKLNNHTVRMIEYNQIRESYHELEEKYIKQELETSIKVRELDEYIKKIKKLEKENQNLARENELLKKRNSTIKNLLQGLIEKYGIESVSNVMGISNIKLKEYLQD